jgi:hypothetical protein
MHHINIKWFGFAVGTTIAIIYIGCVTVTSFISPATATVFCNNLLHGVDVSAIIRKTPTPFLEALLGVVEWFIIGWLAGASIAAIYNAGNKIPKT